MEFWVRPKVKEKLCIAVNGGDATIKRDSKKGCLKMKKTRKTQIEKPTLTCPLYNSYFVLVEAIYNKNVSYNIISI